MSLTIAVDIDGVVCDTFGAWQNIAEREGVEGRFDLEYNGIFKVKTRNGDNFGNLLFSQYRSEWLRDAEPYPDAVRYVNKMAENPHIHLWFVTSRDQSAEEATCEWLNKHGFKNYVDVYFTKNKLDAPCQVLVDDKFSHVEDYTNSSRMGVLMQRPYNKEARPARSVTNMEEFYNLILPYV